MEPWRRRAIVWTFAHERDRVTSMLSLTELLVLGGGRPAEFDAWGMAAVATGCVCPRLPPAGQLVRPSSDVPNSVWIAVGVADLNLHVAVMLKEMQLPAALARVILSGAMQDFIDEVRPTDDGDWLTLGPPGAAGASRSRRGLHCRRRRRPGRWCRTASSARRRGEAGRAGMAGRSGGRKAGWPEWRTASVTGAAVAAFRSCADRVSAQAPDSAPQLKILSPGEDSYVSGPTLLRASIVPAEAAASVTFFVDGRQVCAAHASAVRVRMGRGAGPRRASGTRGRDADGRRTRRADRSARKR